MAWPPSPLGAGLCLARPGVSNLSQGSNLTRGREKGEEGRGRGKGEGGGEIPAPVHYTAWSPTHRDHRAQRGGGGPRER
jgi:hypothetical protein